MVADMRLVSTTGSHSDLSTRACKVRRDVVKKKSLLTFVTVVLKTLVVAAAASHHVNKQTSVLGLVCRFGERSPRCVYLQPEI